MSATGWGLARRRTDGTAREVDGALQAMRHQIGEALAHLQHGDYIDAENDLDGAMVAYEELARRLRDEARTRSSPEVAVLTLGRFREFLGTSSHWQLG